MTAKQIVRDGKQQWVEVMESSLGQSKDRDAAIMIAYSHEHEFDAVFVRRDPNCGWCAVGQKYGWAIREVRSGHWEWEDIP